MLHDDYGVTVPTLTGMKDANRRNSKETTNGNKTKMIHRQKGNDKA